MANDILPDHFKSNVDWTSEELIQIENDCMDEGIFADRLLEITKSQPALWTHDEMYKIEQNVQKDSMRRMAFCFGLSPGKDLIEKIVGDRNFAVAVTDVYKSLPQTIQNYKELVDGFEAIEGRLLIALASREDINAAPCSVNNCVSKVFHFALMHIMPL